MRGWVWLVVTCACGIEARDPVRCGDLVCAPDSVCLADGTCASPPSSPTTLKIDYRGGYGDLVDYPVAVTLDKSLVDYTQIADPSRDLGFRAVDGGVDLPFDVERWDPAGASLVWVQVPRIVGDTFADAIEVYFGPEANRYAGPPTDVWSDVELVIHGAGDLTNAAAMPTTADASNVTVARGLIGDAIAFPPTRDGLVRLLPTDSILDGWSAFTVELWVYADHDLPLTGEPRLLGKEASGSVYIGRLINNVDVEEAVRLQVDMRFGTDVIYPTIYIAPRAWTHIVYTFDGAALRLYRDGAFYGLYRLLSPSPLAADPSTLALGHSTIALIGMIDELRVYKHQLPFGLVHANYLAGTNRLVVPR